MGNDDMCCCPNSNSNTLTFLLAFAAGIAVYVLIKGTSITTTEIPLKIPGFDIPRDIPRDIRQLHRNERENSLKTEPTEPSLSNYLPNSTHKSIDKAKNTAYKNDELWDIQRNTDGSIKSIRVNRDVKVDKQ